MKHLLLAATAAFLGLPRPRRPRKWSSPPTAISTSTTGRYVANPAIFIGDDGRITGIGDARTVRWGADVKHIDLAGQTLLPGLIDMHVHLTSPADTAATAASSSPTASGRRPGSATPRRRSTPASPRCATSARATATTSA